MVKCLTRFLREYWKFCYTQFKETDIPLIYHKLWKRMLPNLKFRGLNMLLFQPFKDTFSTAPRGSFSAASAWKQSSHKKNIVPFSEKQKISFCVIALLPCAVKWLIYDCKRSWTCARFLIFGLWSSQKLGRHKLATSYNFARKQIFQNSANKLRLD